MISALLVTKADRPKLLWQAISDFAVQSYPDKELIVVADDPKTVQEIIDDAVRVVQPFASRVFQARPGDSLGVLRNQSLDMASGDLVIQWDDDDRYSTARMLEQEQVLTASGADICCLARWTLVCSCGLRAISEMKTWSGSILVHKEAVLRAGGWPDLSRGEDSALMDRFAEASIPIVYLDAPDLYDYRYHGGNTWQREHWEKIFLRAGVKGHPSEACEKKRDS